MFLFLDILVILRKIILTFLWCNFCNETQGFYNNYAAKLMDSLIFTMYKK